MIRPLQPRFWWVHLLALILLSAACAAGVWQYNSWKATRTAEARDLTLVDPVPLRDVLGPDDPFPGADVGRPVLLRGTWMPQDTFFVSGRVHRGDRGFWVLTPMLVDGGEGSAIPVVRGWVSSTGKAGTPPRGRGELVAWLQPGEGTGAKDDDPTDRIIPQVRMGDVVQLVDKDLYSAYAVVADKAAPGDWPVGGAATNPGTAGLARAELSQLPSSDRFTGLRNILYSLEWWVMAGFVVFVWWRWCRDEHRRDSGSLTDAGSEQKEGT